MNEFMKSIGTISRCAIQYRGEHFAQYGLNGYQGIYIINICHNPGITQEKLCKLIHVNKSNVTRQLALLESGGFVDRKQCEADKRVTEVYPTQKSIDILPIVLDVFHEWNDYLTSDFTAEEQACIKNLLSVLANRAENYSTEMKY